MVAKITRVAFLSFMGLSLIALLFPVIYFYMQPSIEKKQIKQISSPVIKDKIPYESFVQVLHTTYIEVGKCMSNDIFCPIVNKPMTTRSKGSGVIVGHNGGYTYIITAQHVCEHRKAVGMQIGKFAYSYSYNETVEVVTFVGELLKAFVISSDVKNDLCLLSLPGSVGKRVKVKKEKLQIGEIITNVGAPMGIFTPGMALTFDGRYSGTDGIGNGYFSIPGAPGSSGSAIFDSTGKMVSIVHSAHTQFSHLAIGCLQSNLLLFIHKNREYIGFLMKD